MNNTLLIKGKGFSVGLLFALVEMQLPDKAKHTSIRPKWWHRSVHHELRIQNVTNEEFTVMKIEFFKISEHLSYEVF
jgi:hypothetical protein